MNSLYDLQKLVELRSLYLTPIPGYSTYAPSDKFDENIKLLNLLLKAEIEAKLLKQEKPNDTADF